MVQELRKRLGPDPFALLGVPPEAERSDIQAAYHRIAKVLHPDRLPKGCTPDLVHEADEVYREVTAALQAAEKQAASRGRCRPDHAPEHRDGRAAGAAGPIR